MSRKYFAVQVDEQRVRAGILTEEGVFLARRDIPTRREWSGMCILSDIKTVAEQMTEAQGLAGEEFAGACIALPGTVSEEGILEGSSCLGWGVLDVAGILQRFLEMPVKAVKSIHAAAAGEQWKGAGQREENLVMIAFGPAVETAVLLGGNVFTGPGGMGGMLCRLCVGLGDSVDFGGGLKISSEPNPERAGCGWCGEIGCLEGCVSDAGIERMAAKEFHLNLTAKEVFAQAAEKDPKAIEIVGRVSRCLGFACAQAACVLNPGMFILRGSFARMEADFLTAVREQYQRYVFPEAQKSKFCSAQLGEDAVLYGCGAIAKKAGKTRGSKS